MTGCTRLLNVDGVASDALGLVVEDLDRIRRLSHSGWVQWKLALVSASTTGSATLIVFDLGDALCLLPLRLLIVPLRFLCLLCLHRFPLRERALRQTLVNAGLST